MGTLIFILLLLLPCITTALFKQWRLFWVFITFYICFGVEEGLSIIQTGSSISQHFWALDTLSSLKGWIIVGSMIAMWTALMLHFKLRQKK